MSNQFSIEKQMQVVNDDTDHQSGMHVYNDEQTMTTRQSICFSCEYANTEERICNKCGCPIIMMSQFNFKECPEGKW